MSLNKKEIVQLGQLARLHIAPQDEAPLTEALNNILDLANQLTQENTSGVTPLTHPLALIEKISLRLREDIVTEDNQRENNQACAPAIENNLFLVPKVIE